MRNLRNGLAICVIFSGLQLSAFAEEAPKKPSLWQKIKEKTCVGAQCVKNHTVETAKAIAKEVNEVKKDVVTVIHGTMHPVEKINFVMAAIGDSLSNAVNAELPFNRSFDLRPVHLRFNIHPVVHEKLSWATGDVDPKIVDSHYNRLRRMGVGNVVGINAALHGSEASDLGRQADKVLKNYDPNYVTILTGANDLCIANSNPEQQLVAYEQAITGAIEKFRRRRLGVKVLLVGIPNLERIYELGRNSDRCQTLWRTWGFCRPMLGTDATSHRRQQVMKQWAAMNHILKDIADQNPNTVKYSAKLADAQFETEHVSDTDCFHPSMKGQNAMAKETWNESWYADAPLAPIK